MAERGIRDAGWRLSASMDADAGIYRGNARIVDQGRGLLRGQVREVPAGAAVSEAGAEGRAAGADREQGQECAQVGGAMGRRLVPDFPVTPGNEDRVAEVAPGMLGGGPRFWQARFHDYEALAARRPS